MAGRYSTKKSKAPVIFIISAIAVVVIAVVCIIVFAFPKGQSDNKAVTTQPASTVESTTVESTSSASDSQEETTIAEETTVQAPTTSAKVSEPEKVVLPTESDETSSYFSATFSPYKAVDTSTGEECSLREVFGSSYSGGNITFTSDGSFTDSLSASSVNSGAYAVSGESISATYTNDKNMPITVIQWNGNAPSEFIVNYGGYDVYFN